MIYYNSNEKRVLRVLCVLYACVCCTCVVCVCVCVCEREREEPERVCVCVCVCVWCVVLRGGGYEWLYLKERSDSSFQSLLLGITSSKEIYLLPLVFWVSLAEQFR